MKRHFLKIGQKTLKDAMDENEDKACTFLESKGLSVCGYSKQERRTSKTPDFRVFLGDELVFLAEVKAIAEDEEFEGLLAQAPFGTLIGKSEKDNILERIQRKIEEAWGQFNAVDPGHALPWVLIFVSEDSLIGFDYLMDVLTGCFYDEEGVRYPIYAKYSEGKIAEKKLKIDLHIWADEEEPKFFFTLGGIFQTRLQKLFKIDHLPLRDLSAVPLRRA